MGSLVATGAVGAKEALECGEEVTLAVETDDEEFARAMVDDY
jgi:hypothetical protein